MDAWWIDEPRLLGSANPTDAELERLRGEGFAVIVSFLAEDAQPPRYEIARARALGYARHNIAVPDFGAPTVAELARFVALVEGAPVGDRIVAHCEGGTGRTGTFATAYWVAKGLTVGDAIARVRGARPRAVETPGQERALEAFARRPRAR